MVGAAFTISSDQRLENAGHNVSGATYPDTRNYPSASELPLSSENET